MEAWPLAQLPVPRLELLRGLAVLHDGIDAIANLFHLLEVGVLVGLEHLQGSSLVDGQRHDARADSPRDVRPTVLDQVLIGCAAGLVGGEVLQPPLLPPRGGDLGEPVRVGRSVVAYVDRGRCALEDVQLLARSRQPRHALHRRGTGADDGDTLVRELVHRPTERIAAGVVVVPPARVERVTGELVDAGDAGELRHVQRAGAHAEERRGELIASVGADHPSLARLVPGERRDLGVEQRVVVEPEVLSDPLAVLEDLRSVRVLLGRHVAGFLEQRHVDERRGVALRARVAVPVPGPTEVTGFVDDAHVVDTGLLQPRAGHEPRETATDERHRHVVGLRPPLDVGRVGVLRIVSEPAGEPHVLVVAVRPQPLEPLFAVLGAQSLFVRRRRGWRSGGCLHAAIADRRSGGHLGKGEHRVPVPGGRHGRQPPFPERVVELGPPIAVRRVQKDLAADDGVLVRAEGGRVDPRESRRPGALGEKGHGHRRAVGGVRLRRDHRCQLGAGSHQDRRPDPELIEEPLLQPRRELLRPRVDDVAALQVRAHVAATEALDQPNEVRHGQLVAGDVHAPKQGGISRHGITLSLAQAGPESRRIHQCHRQPPVTRDTVIRATLTDLLR